MKQLILKSREYFPQLTSVFLCGFDDFENYDNMLSQYGKQMDDLIIRKYGNWIYDDEHVNVTRDVIIDFRNDFNAYLFTNKNNFDMLLKAMNGTYDPLANYDKNSTITTVKSGSEINSGSNTNGATHTVTTDRLAPDNEEEFYNSSETETSSNDIVNTNSNTLTFDDRTDTVTEHTTGNIGVMHGADMLSREISVRFTPIFEYIVSSFVKSRCY